MANTITRATSGKAERPRWTWNEWIWNGKLNLLYGAPSAGKSSLMCWLMARSMGYGEWPDGRKATRGGHGLFVTTEEPLNESLLPQMDSLGVPAERWSLIDDPGPDAPQTILDTEWPEPLRLIVVDPIISGRSGNMNDAVSARALCEEWANVARALDCPVLATNHTVKGRAKHQAQGRWFFEMGAGSQQFSATARVVLYLERPQDKRGRRLLYRAKINAHIADGETGYWLDAAQTGEYRVWQIQGMEAEPNALEALQAMTAPDAGEYAPSDGSAAAALLEYMEGVTGSEPAAAVKSAVALKSDCTVRAVEKAAADLIERGLLQQAGGGKGGTKAYWSLPAVDDFPDDDDDAGIPF